MIQSFMNIDILQPPDDPITFTAQKYFSISYLYPIQRYAIANSLDSINQIVVLPTGSGKSLCFQLPALILPGITLVVLPLLSLMEDQIRRLNEKQIGNGCIKGEQTQDERYRLFNDITNGSIKIVFITPESLLSKKLDSFFSKIKISHFIIDEAHCVTEWGDTFRPAYLAIGKFIKKWNPGVVTAFTATASPTVMNKIKHILFDDLPASTLVENPDRPNISYSVIPVLSKSRAVTELMKKEAHPIIVYTRSRKRAEYYAHLLRERLETDQVFFYHAGLYKEERKTIEKWFMKSDEGILTATTAFGMGIDKSNVRTVVHCDVPLSAESYLQESGRAGRDKKEAEAVLLYSDEDLKFISNIQDPVQKNRYESMLHYITDNNACRRASLLSFLDYKFEEACSGCDYCSGTIISEIAEKNKILEFIKKNKRMYTLRELKQIFAGKKTYEVVKKDLDCAQAFGLLSSWDPEDIEEALHCFIDSGKIYIPQKGFWKHRVTLR